MSWDGKGSTRAWRKVRAVVLDRDGHQCQILGPRCTNVATTVDHMADWSGDPAAVPLHLLRAACAPCNQSLLDRHHRTDPPAVVRSRW